MTCYFRKPFNSPSLRLFISWVSLSYTHSVALHSGCRHSPTGAVSSTYNSSTILHTLLWFRKSVPYSHAHSRIVCPSTRHQEALAAYNNISYTSNFDLKPLDRLRELWLIGFTESITATFYFFHYILPNIYEQHLTTLLDPQCCKKVGLPLTLQSLRCLYGAFPHMEDEPLALTERYHLPLHSFTLICSLC